MKRFIVPLVITGLLAMTASLALAGGETQNKAGKKAGATRYMVMVPHTPEECMKTLDDFDASKNMSKWDFGCESGDHTAYMMVTAKSEDDARAMVPEAERANAKIIALHKFTSAELKQLHAGMTKQ